MIEIRPIYVTEAETFLGLLCDVFSLDYNRAYDVFFTEPYFDLNRKWALFDGGKMISILTTSPLQFGWGKAVGIAGVATKKEHRREGYAGRLLQRVLTDSERAGETGALLFARETKVYEANGFEPLDRVVRAAVTTCPEPDRIETLDFEDVRAKYEAWSAGHPDRLRRDEKRWEYWQWHCRTCSPFQDGYLCAEPGTLREAIFSKPQTAIPLPEGLSFFGTTFMADLLELPVRDAVVELYLMGHNIPGVPQMFMTDQF